MAPNLASTSWPTGRALLLLLATACSIWTPAAGATGKSTGPAFSRAAAPVGSRAGRIFCTPNAHAPTNSIIPSCARIVLSDGDILVELRRALHDLRGPWSGGLPGWNPGDVPDPCRWSGVECSNGTWVTRIRLTRKDVDNYTQIAVDDLAIHQARCGTGHKGPTWELPPEALAPLAQLAHLEELELSDGMVRLDRGLPQEWGAPGAFRRLKSLELWACSMASPALELQPGALPLLERFSLDAPATSVALPASWGAPGAWPMLRTLRVIAPLAGTLPPAWADGFRRLDSLFLAEPAALPAGIGPHLDTLQAEERSRRGPHEGAAFCEWLPTRQLPPQWGAGFPVLRELTLSEMCLSGPIPAEWLNGTALQLVSHLVLSGNNLSGTLPRGLAAQMPVLRNLRIDRNNFSGSLPSDWAQSQLETLVAFVNNLSGPAFPPAWVAPGALPSLREMDLSNNQLTGALPARVPWPRLSKLDVSANPLSGTLPVAWCLHMPSDANFPKLGDTGVQPQQCHEKTVAGAPMSTRARAAAALVREDGSARAWLPVALLAAVLGAVLVTLLLARRRDTRPSAEGRYRRLHSDSDSQSSWTSAEPLGPWPGTNNAVLGALRRRRQRVTSLLRTGGGVVQMEPLGPLPSPSDMAHQMAPLPRMPLVPPLSSIELAALQHNSATAPPAPASWGWQLGSHSLAIPAEELHFVADEFGELVVLGEGATGICYLARVPVGEVAVKVFELGPEIDPASVWREVRLLKRCVHPRIVPLYGIARKGALLMLVLRLMRGGSLQRALQNPELHEALVWHNGGLQVATDIAEALAFLHGKQEMMHSDLSGANVLLDEDLRAYVSDFGVAQVVGQSARTVAGFHWVHAAPEQLLGERCSYPADMYSFGLLLIQLTTHAVVVKRGEWRLPHVPHECSQSVLELIEQCVASNPRERPTAAQALERLRAEHPGNQAPSA